MTLIKIDKKTILKLKNNPLVVYLLYNPIAKKTLRDFINSYKKFNSGKKHELLICFKGFNDNYKNISYWRQKIPFKYTFYLDKEQKNDFDIGSFFRIAENFNNRLILFLGSYSNPNCKNWLKIFISNYENNSVLAAHGSYASISSQCLSFKYKDLSIYQSIKYGLVHLFYSKLFPNPHIRTSAFMINAKDFLELKCNKNQFIKKIFTNYFESGRFGMSNQLIKKGFKLLVVNSENNKFDLPNWPKSETAFLPGQKKLVISDLRTKKYDRLSKKKKFDLTKMNWGKTYKFI